VQNHSFAFDSEVVNLHIEKPADLTANQIFSPPLNEDPVPYPRTTRPSYRYTGCPRKSAYILNIFVEKINS
jgi:hypothetical protein